MWLDVVTVVQPWQHKNKMKQEWRTLYTKKSQILSYYLKVRHNIGNNQTIKNNYYVTFFKSKNNPKNLA